MPGLIAGLDGVFAGGSFSASLNVQVDGLDEITGAVTALLDGPPDLSDLQGLIANLPLPPGLGALGALPVAIQGLLDGFDLGDIEGLLLPVLGPLASIGGAGFSLSAVANIKASVCLVQHVLTLVNGSSSGGDGLPLPAALWGRQAFGVTQDLSPEEVRERIEEMEAQLGLVENKLNGPGFVELLRRLGPRWDEMKNWPHLPVVTDVMEIAGVAVKWSELDGPRLTSELDRRLGEIQTLIAMPRDRVADPLIAQAELAARLPQALQSFQSAGIPLLTRLADKTENGIKPTYNELGQLEARIEELSAAVGALGLGPAPLGRLDDLVRDLELHLLRSVRAMVPPYDVSIFTDRVQGFMAAIPPAVADPLAEAVAAIGNLDVSFLTDPLSSIKDGVQEVVDTIQGALADLSSALTNLLSPLADGLDSAIQASGLAGIQAELAGLPATIESFVDDQIAPVVEPIRSAVETAVETVDSAVNQFDPEQIIAPLRDAIEEVAELINTDEVAGVAAQVQEALQTATAAIESLDFAGAADEVVALLDEIKTKVSAIDPISLPQPALEIAEQAVSVITDVDFSGQVAGPILDQVGQALAEGPALVLDQLQAGVDELKDSLERFKPSVVVGETLDAPFDDVISQIDTFTPSDLLNGISDLLRGAVEGINLVDPSVLIGPLTEVHGTLVGAVDSAKPSTLLGPVDAAIASAIERLFEATGIDDVFDGIDSVLSSIRDWVALVNETRTLLDKMAQMLANPGDPEAALDELVATLVGRLDPVNLAALSGRFDALAETVRSVEAGVLAPRINRALRAAQAAVPALGGQAATAVVSAARSFPLAKLESSPEAPARLRLIESVRHLRALAGGIEAAPAGWTRLNSQIDQLAPRLEASLVTYRRLSVIDGKSVFAECIIPKPSLAELKAAVAAAARDGLKLPVIAVFGLLAKLAPLVASVASGLAQIVGAIHEKLDLLTGQSGVGGVVSSIEEAADLLRNLNLSPVTGPLDALFARIQTAVGLLDPEPLGDVLQAGADAVSGLLDLSNLIDPASVAALDTTYQAAVDKLKQLKPSVIVAGTLDPVYEELLGNILPLLELPALLKELLEAAGTELSTEVEAQLARIELAFDQMLRAIPFGPMSGSASVSVSVSASASVG